MICNVISTGSKGNAVIYHGSILVDYGVSFSQIQNYMYTIQIVLATHWHSDHINISTLKKLQFERPSLRIGCCAWMLPYMDGLKNVDVYDIGGLYDYGLFSIKPIRLYHDVPNCGYRIFKGLHRTLHATDTAHLEGIEAKDYDLYAIEHNYDQDISSEIIEMKSSQGIYSYEKNAISNHLSVQQASAFINANRKSTSEVVRLHESDRYRLK